MQRWIQAVVERWRAWLGDDGSVRRWLIFSLVMATMAASAAFVLAGDRIWSVHAIDRAVIFLVSTLVAGLILSLFTYILSPRSKTARRFTRRVARFLAAAFITLGVYVAYASMRNQTQIDTEDSLNQEGLALYAIEMDSPALRCLYYNYRLTDPVECLNQIIKDEKLWTLAIFYVEETWFMLTKSQEDSQKWGSEYADSIQFWANDVSADPTGIFTYYAVMLNEDEPSPISATRLMMEQAEVCVPNICERFGRVHSALAAAGAAPKGRAARQCEAPPQSNTVRCKQ